MGKVSYRDQPEYNKSLLFMLHSINMHYRKHASLSAVSFFFSVESARDFLVVRYIRAVKACSLDRKDIR